MRDGPFHNFDRRTCPVSGLNVVELPKNIHGRTPGDSGHVAHPFERLPVTCPARDDFSLVTRANYQFALGNAPLWDVSDESGMRVAGDRACRIFRQLDDAIAKRLSAARR